jgi:hypothetical protein
MTEGPMQGLLCCLISCHKTDHGCSDNIYILWDGTTDCDTKSGNHTAT